MKVHQPELSLEWTMVRYFMLKALYIKSSNCELLIDYRRTVFHESYTQDYIMQHKAACFSKWDSWDAHVYCIFCKQEVGLLLFAVSLTLSPCGGNFRDLFPFLSPMGLMPDNYTPTAEQQRMSPEFIGQATTGLDVT